MRRMMAACRVHNFVKQPPVSVVGELASLVISYKCTAVLLHPQLKIGQRLAAYRYSPVAACLSFAVTDDKVTLLELDVTFLDGQKFARPHSAITHHHDTHRPARQRIITVSQLLYPVELTGDKRLFRIPDHLFVYVNVAGYIG